MDGTPINWIDGISLAILTWFSLVGLWVGFAQSVFNLLALSIAVGTSWALTAPSLTWLKTILNMGDSGAFYKIATAILLFLVTYLIVRKTGTLIHKFLHKNALGTLNRLGGLFFGALKAGVILSAFYILLGWIPRDLIEPSRQQSKAFHLFERTPVRTWVSQSTLKQYAPPIPQKIPLPKNLDSLKTLPTGLNLPNKNLTDSLKQILKNTSKLDETIN